MNFNESDEFIKAFKRLSKKYRSLPDDLLEFKKVVSEFPLGSGKHFVVLHSQEEIKILKARLFCRYLRGTSLRIVYAYRGTIKTIDFIELYFKGEQVNETKSLINDFLNQF
ncbi:hypothetical protein GW888_00185 [Candidatus Wolfebacteria bacterium]|uniref:Uncharacterized protein n=1 Tax=Candidatus Wolfebacteria bacterium CG_4_10_14_0_2_um_filter_39_18 TaxID=1975061 RepID=A0A2M7TFQ6_9BACT|nr:hypothetical protein [Candidatus Wolfebacteria bacterium]NCO44484.1 hypothetical protein [Candidatus Wolfebacteria bacterium]PIZ44762.1 MAG: hypothetical protein COY31_01925 [Candidatus Wolfebacteria bacterium CG_4_10_14_0_2_um_filter_39_18]